MLRDLYLLKFDKTLSFGEKRMLDHAQQLLVKELAMAKNMIEQAIELELEQIFADAVIVAADHGAGDKKVTEGTNGTATTKAAKAAALVEVVPQPDPEPEPEPEPEPTKLPAKPKSRSTARPKAKTGTLRS